MFTVVASLPFFLYGDKALVRIDVSCFAFVYFLYTCNVLHCCEGSACFSFQYMHILLILECKFVTVRPSNLAVLNGIVVVRVYIFGIFREYQSGFW